MGALLDLALQDDHDHEPQANASRTPSSPSKGRVDLTDYFPDALKTGCLKICERCSAFTARPASRPDGWCKRYSTETWARVPFRCDGYEPLQ